MEAPALVNQLIKTNKHFETYNEKAVDENFNNKEEKVELNEEFEDKQGVKVNEEFQVKDDFVEDKAEITELPVEATNEEAFNNKKEEFEVKGHFEEDKGDQLTVETSKVEVTNKQASEDKGVYEYIEVIPIEARPLEVKKEDVEELKQEEEKIEKKEELEVVERPRQLSTNINENSEDNGVTKEKQEHLSIDINGLPLPSTPLEEEEKKKFLDSIPHLENNSDSIAVSKKAKKEYYQSLRKYLIHEEENKPPVPLQTYRWEDLRRAKERVSGTIIICTSFIVSLVDWTTVCGYNVHVVAKRLRL